MSPNEPIIVAVVNFLAAHFDSTAQIKSDLAELVKPQTRELTMDPQPIHPPMRGPKMRIRPNGGLDLKLGICVPKDKIGPRLVQYQDLGFYNPAPLFEEPGGIWYAVELTVWEIKDRQGGKRLGSEVFDRILAKAKENGDYCQIFDVD